MTFPAFALLALLLAALPGNAPAADLDTSQVMEELLDLPLEELLQVKISTAAKYEQRTAEAPASVTLVPAAEIQLYGYRTLAEVLRHAAGFYLSDDRNYTYLGVRGFSRPSDHNNRVLLLLNGHPLNESIFGQALLDHELPLDMDSVEKIEIVRGPGSALYGSYAMFAVVNVVTRKGGTPPGVRLEAEGGSWGRRELSAAYAGTAAGKLQVHLSGRWGEAEGQDYFYPEYAASDPAAGHSRHSDGERYRGLHARLDWGDLTVQGLHAWRHKALPTGAYETLLGDRRTWTRDLHSFAEARLDRPLGGERRLVLRAYLDDAPYRGSYLYPDFLQLDKTENRAFGGEGQFHAALPRAHRLVAGGEFRRDFRASYRLYDEEGVDFSGNYPFHQYSFYLQDHWAISPSLSALLGARHDRSALASPTTTPRVALLYHPTPRAGFKLLYGAAFRAPGIWESRVEDEHLGYLANPDLKPEKIRTAELVWEQGLARWLFQTVSFYEYRMENLIDQVEVGEGEYQFQNTSAARARGTEMQWEARRAGGAHGYIRYTLQRAEDEDTGRRLTNSPAQLLRLGGGSPLGPYLRASVQLLGESRRLTLRQSHTGAFWLADLHLTFTPPRHWILGGAQPRLALRAHNLFDAGYAVPAGLDLRQGAIAQDGRNLALLLECAW